MSRHRIRTKEVLVYLGVEEKTFLRALREEGLFEHEELEPEEADDLRVATVLMQEMGVNPAGVEVALHLRRRLLALEERARRLAEILSESDER